jgi:hypothetical protein
MLLHPPDGVAATVKHFSLRQPTDIAACGCRLLQLLLPSRRQMAGPDARIFSGQGLVYRFEGRGKVWRQTRKAAAFVAWAWPFRPVTSRG